MPTIIYVDNDDEITSAAARIRVTDAGRVALVVPSGSRISTSRINFRLLAREAQTRGRHLAIVAGDGSTRALAASAGLTVFGTVGEFEASVRDEATSIPAIATAPVAEPKRAPQRVSRRVPASPGAADAAVATAPPTAAAAPPIAAEPVSAPTAATAATAARRDPAPTAIVLPGLLPERFVSRRPPAAAAAALLALALAILAVGAYLLLPTATVTVTPRLVPIAPLALSIRADPAITSADAAAGTVPAQRLNFDLVASNTFRVKGRRIEEARATGQVTFRSYNTGNANTVPAGSIVSTEGGIQFRTKQAARLGRAQLVPGAPGFAVIPSKDTVDITAVRAGTGGNVPPNSITVVPRSEDPVLTRVTNADPTAGGTHDEFPRIDQADIDAAVAQLVTQLDDEFDAILTQPGRVPANLTAFPQTRSLITPDPDAEVAALLGKEVETFDLQMTSTGSVVAVDQSLVTTLAANRIGAMASTGHAVVDGSVQVDVGQPTVDSDTIVFPVTASASEVRVVDPPSLVRLIKGKPIPQARAALAPFGDVNVTVWPDWVSSIPTIDARIDLQVAPPTAATP
jgi:baseplate J-like protein